MIRGLPQYWWPIMFHIRAFFWEFDPFSIDDYKYKARLFAYLALLESNVPLIAEDF
jgi:hypothetical protein